ncbi:uncharacterized protein STEHIDRAFT_125271 [Stereum hirsutum FP-91666 SS1]|uniref:uncharacterized protein n=1 Tax=Stereum hirsutum (strain FP-91666) TaxID=721885 RepID=UPI0004449788|nr:uncharacterized protein STEHIDRAFT_125271 [Stereum hirsutum FP-91666 SS1]EIM80948.1 hypothetical protein STEHIDRAFT_125271 [Stereum hirsutum FP-91666 SS1]
MRDRRGDGSSGRIPSIDDPEWMGVDVRELGLSPVNYSPMCCLSYQEDGEGA